MRKIDHSRYKAVVYGDPERAWLQDGIYFNGAGEAVSGETTKPATPAAVSEPPVVVEQKGNDAARVAELNAMHITKLRALAGAVNKATGADLPEAGTGAKARLVTYIVDNTTD